MTNDRPNRTLQASRTTGARTAQASVLTGLCVFSTLITVAAVTPLAMADESASATTRPAFGQNTRAWLDEQRNDVNRAEPEPYPASRAAAAVQRYEATVGTDSGGSATRAGTGIGIRSGSPAAGNPPSPGMGR